MNESTKLIEQGFRSWESTLRHVDVTATLTDEAQSALRIAHAVDARLTQIVTELDQCTKSIEALRRQSFDPHGEAARHCDDVKGRLASVGERLDQVMAAMLDCDGNT